MFLIWNGDLRKRFLRGLLNGLLRPETALQLCCYSPQKRPQILPAKSGWHYVRGKTNLALYWLRPERAGMPLSSKAFGKQNAGSKREKEKKMPKLKTHTGAKKRFSKTGTGKIKRGQTKTRHILTSKPPKVKRKLGRTLLVSDGDYKKVARMIPYA
jgi:large subunit ribosomal protein L35